MNPRRRRHQRIARRLRVRLERYFVKHTYSWGCNPTSIVIAGGKWVVHQGPIDYVEPTRNR
jgi:hypothetical protein